MPEYLVTDPQTGRQVKITGDSPPSEQELEQIFGSLAPKDERNILARTLNPIKEAIGEAPMALQNLSPEDALNLARGGEDKYGLRLRNPDPNAAMSSDEMGRPVLQYRGEMVYLNAPGLSMGDIAPTLGAVDRVAKEAAPYLAGGAAPLKLGAGMLTQAGIGLASETINQTGNALTGKETNWAKLATTPMYAAGGEAAGRAAYAVLRPVVGRLVGSQAPREILNEDGTLTEETIRALRDNAVDPAQFDDLVIRELARMRQAGEITAEQAERFNFFRSQGLEPTRAQVTRSADDFMLQQEAAKTGTVVREALEGQQNQIAEAFETTLLGTGGNATSSGSPVADAVLNKAITLDTEISELYRVTREATSGAKVVRVDNLAGALRQNAPQNEISGGLIRALRGDLESRGLIDRNFRPTGRVDVDTAEEVRKVMNSFHNSTTDRGRQILRELKDALDQDVLTTTGDDAYRQARQAKARFESGLNTTRLSKFDTNDRSLVREVLENKIKAEDVFDRAVLSKTWKAKDLNELRSYLTSGSQEQVAAGTQAWNDLRAETVQWIRDEVFQNAMDQAGRPTMRSGAIKRSIDRIGAERLEVLFTGPERDFLNNMVRLEALRQPVPGTGMGRGPSAQAIAAVEGEVKKVASRLPMLGPLLEILESTARSRAAVNNPINQALKEASRVTVRNPIPGAALGAEGGDRMTWGN